MKLTAIGSGYFKVYKDGVEVSKHTSEREALESAINLEIINPSSNIIYKHEYEVKVESDPGPIITPIPVTTPIPTPITTPSPLGNIYAATSFWNKKLSSEVVSQVSSSFVLELFENVKIAGVSVNTTNYSRPIYTVTTDIPKTKVFLPQKSGSKNDNILQQGIRIPQGIVVSGGTDGHLCIIDLVSGIEYDFWKFRFNNNRWEAADAGIMPNVLTSDGTMEKYSDGSWNSATATHLPLLGGTIRINPSDYSLSVNQCVAIAINRPKAHPSLVWPAKTTDGWYTGANAIPEGMRFRFPSSITIDPNWTPITKMLVTAIRDYGMVVMDKTGAGVSFYCEDPTQYGKDASILTQYYGGKSGYKIFGDKNNLSPEFPWDKLQTLE